MVDTLKLYTTTGGRSNTSITQPDIQSMRGLDHASTSHLCMLEQYLKPERRSVVGVLLHAKLTMRGEQSVH